ncbi:hypothetical protein [Glycomyces algeriensis]|uniref:hypothetical protein n=1 Tax=Glycomyces algeriensis TaxID=256037 RepID=UPI00249216E8|nr:hypothetical protein [Glycomyces algeriensis]
MRRGIALAIAFLVFASCGVGLRLRDRTDPPTTITIGDIVRPDLRGPLPTTADIESWKSAFSGFAMQWPDNDALQTSRPDDLISFDDHFDGYLAGTAEFEGTSLTAVIGFEDEAIAWFTCHAMGPRTTSADAFLRTCWAAAAVTGADQDAGAAWVDSVLALETEEFTANAETVCPAVLLAAALNPMSGYINTQITIAAGQNC